MMRQLKISNSITNRDQTLGSYLTWIAKFPLLNIEEEIELSQKIKHGGTEGEKAREKLVTSNLRFVVSVAKQYQHQGLALSDLINEGNIGLMKAADKFDETRGFKFISYGGYARACCKPSRSRAAWCVCRSMWRACCTP